MDILDELRQALRALRRNRGATAVTAATLALGVGANSAMFSVVNGVLLRALPYDHPERIATPATCASSEYRWCAGATSAPATARTPRAWCWSASRWRGALRASTR